MLASGEWAPDDDERLLGALLEGQYKEPWQVLWGQPVAGRDAATARRRWLALTVNSKAPKHGGLELLDYVAVMAQHYCPFVWAQHMVTAEEEEGA